MGYVYLIGTTVYGWYKIGKSKTPEVRVRDLGILLPFKIEVMAVWRAENHHLMETALHEMHAAHRINGEWFEFTKEKLGEVIAAVPADTLLPKSTFSNIHEDLKDGKRVLGVRKEKLRGDFTLEERAAKRAAGAAEVRQRRMMRESQAGLFDK